MSPSNTVNEISRRKFLGYAGGFAGLTALASVGMMDGWEKNHVHIDLANDSDLHHSDVLVIGGGMAGLFAAVKAHDAGAKVALVSKGRLGSSGQTPFAKGIFAYDASKEKLSIDEFVEKVGVSAMGSNNDAYTRQLAEQSLARVNELKDWGFFDSSLYNKSFSRPMDERSIPIHERIVVTHLLKENGRISGAAGFSLDDGKVHFYQSKSVILCTGAGGFKPNGFPICDLTHDGTAMAYRIGAKVTGKEWNDGHPGRAEHPAACYDGWGDMFEKKPSTTSIGIRHDLGVDMNYMAYTSGGAARMGPPGRGRRGPSGPTIGSNSGPRRPDGLDDFGQHERGRGGPPPGGKKKGGPPPGMGGSPVGGSSAGMAIHKSEGLVPMNEFCESNIPGLYAAGDALGSHMSGGIYTQIGSSLSGSAVQGAISGERAAAYAKESTHNNLTQVRMSAVKREILAPVRREAGYGPAWVTQALQSVMIPNFVLYIKKERMLQAALAFVEELRDHHLPMLRASDAHELRLAHETINMVLNAEMKLRASMMRKESRCSHYRLDYPETDDQNWRAWINIYQGENGRMKLEKQSFDSWPDGTSIV